jgi:hypothetical protein
MKQLLLPFYAPIFPAPERAVLTLLHAALRVTEDALRDAHPLMDASARDAQLESGAPIVVAASRLIVGRCSELRALLDFYDTAVDEYIASDVDEPIPF